MNGSINQLLDRTWRKVMIIEVQQHSPYRRSNIATKVHEHFGKKRFFLLFSAFRHYCRLRFTFMSRVISIDYVHKFVIRSLDFTVISVCGSFQAVQVFCVIVVFRMRVI